MRDAFDLLGEANPVPAPDRLVRLQPPEPPRNPALRALLDHGAVPDGDRPHDATIGRDPTMDTTTRPTPAPETEQPQRRVPLALAAAIAAVLALGATIAVLLTQASQDAPVVDDPAPAETPTADDGAGAATASPTLDEVGVARAIVTALDRHDATAVADRLAPDAVVSFLVATSPAGIPDAVALSDVLDWRFDLQSCSPASATGFVTCDVLQRDRWSEALGVAAAPAQVQLQVVDGEAQSLTYSLDQSAWGPEVLAAFFAFVVENHPDDVPVMFDVPQSDLAPVPGSDEVASLPSGPRVTPESLELFDRYTTEFEEAQGS